MGTKWPEQSAWGVFVATPSKKSHVSICEPPHSRHRLALCLALSRRLYKPMPSNCTCSYRSKPSGVVRAASRSLSSSFFKASMLGRRSIRSARPQFRHHPCAQRVLTSSPVGNTYTAGRCGNAQADALHKGHSISRTSKDIAMRHKGWMGSFEMVCKHNNCQHPHRLRMSGHFCSISVPFLSSVLCLSRGTRLPAKRTRPVCVRRTGI